MRRRTTILLMLPPVLLGVVWMTVEVTSLRRYRQAIREHLQERDRLAAERSAAWDRFIAFHGADRRPRPNDTAAAEVAAADAALQRHSGMLPRPQRPSRVFPILCVLSMLPHVLMSLREKYAGRNRQHRLAQSCCIHCGYDVRATPIRCPECGGDPVR